MLSPDLINIWKKDEAAPFSGWDFSYLKGRTHAETPPWDYLELARQYLANSQRALDMATGGGERLASLLPARAKVWATEFYPPNVEIARRRLQPLGVTVVDANITGQLPFDDASFDLILNRHEGGFTGRELNRLLVPGGVFLTQQVGGTSESELLAHFNSKPKWPEFNLARLVKDLEDSGFCLIKAEEWEGREFWHDVGAVVYALKNTPWMVDSFSVDGFLGPLEKLQEKLEKDGTLSFNTASYIALARKKP
jgi:SAM-dependent methyltransferase